MATEVIWMRVGDQDDYHEFDDLEEAAQYLADFYRLERIDRYKKYGVCAQGFTGQNYISLYWGLPDPGDGSAEATRELTDGEIEEVNESLEACFDCGYFDEGPQKCWEDGDEQSYSDRR